MNQHTTQYPIASKRCPDCGETKAASEYNINRSRGDGLQGICRACQTKRRADDLARNTDKIQARIKEWNAANRERLREYGRNSYREHREQRLAYSRAMKQAEPGKYAAHRAVQVAVRSGILPRVEDCRCAVCGTSSEQGAVMHYHHPDYSNPLDVIPVCSPCHWQIHHAADE